MERGWAKRGHGVPLADRIAAQIGGLPVEPASPAGPVDATQPLSDLPGPARHCWVADAADRLGVKRPGLLIEWRRREGWEGRVVYAATLRPGEWQLVEEWLPASQLTSG